MEFVILGLLLLKPRTLYELNKTLAEKISLFYSASFGSISSAINKLLEKGWIELREHIERGRNKKIYTITAAGQSAFHDWLNSAIAPEKVKEPALTRLFFLGYLDPAQRIASFAQASSILGSGVSTSSSRSGSPQRCRMSVSAAPRMRSKPSPIPA